MPPIKKYSREDIIEVGYNLAKNEGLNSINARRIAQELGCSVQPIFHNFKNMEEVIDEVYKAIYRKYQSYMLADKEGNYKQMGLSYIKFAKDYPEFFKIIFMQKTTLKVEKFILTDSAGDMVIRAGQKLTGLDYEEQKKFHVKVWIFTHGIACLVATKTVNFEDDEIEELLTTTVMEMLKGKRRKNEKNN